MPPSPPQLTTWHWRPVHVPPSWVSITPASVDVSPGPASKPPPVSTKFWQAGSHLDPRCSSTGSSGEALTGERHRAKALHVDLVADARAPLAVGACRLALRAGDVVAGLAHHLAARCLRALGRARAPNLRRPALRARPALEAGATVLVSEHRGTRGACIEATASTATTERATRPSRFMCRTPRRKMYVELTGRSTGDDVARSVGERECGHRRNVRCKIHAFSSAVSARRVRRERVDEERRSPLVPHEHRPRLGLRPEQTSEIEVSRRLHHRQARGGDPSMAKETSDVEVGTGCCGSRMASARIATPHVLETATSTTEPPSVGSLSKSFDVSAVVSKTSIPASGSAASLKLPRVRQPEVSVELHHQSRTGFADPRASPSSRRRNRSKRRTSTAICDGFSSLRQVGLVVGLQRQSFERDECLRPDDAHGAHLRGCDRCPCRRPTCRPRSRVTCSRAPG